MPDQTSMAAQDALARKQQAVRTLVDEIAALYSTDPLTEPVRAQMIGASTSARLELDPRILPVGVHFRTAVANAANGPCAPIAAALAALAPDLCWEQNANYLAAPPSADFLNNYGYVEFVGPGRPMSSEAVRVGLLLLGPKTSYPAHRHPAEEIYHVISGRARWWRQGSGWRHESAGALIHHAPGVPHAMACSEQPLLALYCWLGDIEAAAQLC